MKILLDTNIILDVLLQRTPFYDNAVTILRLSESRYITSYITANSISDIFYVLRKYFDTAEERKVAIQCILGIIHITGVTRNDVLKALASDCSDLEDAIQLQCAEKIHADYIVTRNTRDFHTPKAIRPGEFLALF